jgi:hypothetical protein
MPAMTGIESLLMNSIQNSAFTQLSRPVNERLKEIHDPTGTAGKVN